MWSWNNPHCEYFPPALPGLFDSKSDDAFINGLGVLIRVLDDDWKKKVLASSSIKSIRKKGKWSSLLTLRASGILGSEKSSNAELGAPYLLTKWTFGMKASEKENGLETKKWNVRKKFRAKLTLQAQKITNLHIPKRVHWCISTVPSQFNSLATSHICSDIFLSTEIHRIFSRSYSLPLQSRENKIFNLYM